MDRIVAETNNGGEMVEMTLRTVDGNAAFKAVHASRGKFTRAEPVSALYEQARIHHVGAFPLLEDQICGFTPDLDRERAKSSPDRVDALVWAFTELMVDDGPGAWIAHYGGLARAAHDPAASMSRRDPLPWRPVPAPTRPVMRNELFELYLETRAAVKRDTLPDRCCFCGAPMEPGATRVSDGFEVWHPACR